MTITPELINKVLASGVIAPNESELKPEQAEFMEAACKSKELTKNMGLMTSLMVNSVRDGFFEGAMSSCLVLIFLGYAIAKEEMKEVEVAGAIQ